MTGTPPSTQMPAQSIMAPMEYEAEKCASRRDQPSPWSVYRRLRLRRREIEIVESSINGFGLADGIESEGFAFRGAYLVVPRPLLY